MIGLYLLLGVVFGLPVGSFLNVVIFRAPKHLSVVSPGSFCPRCGSEIASRDNIPVFSWLALRGRCRSCSEPISPRYPIIEATTAAFFVAIAATVRPLWGVPGWWVLVSTIFVATIVGFDGEKCPIGATAAGTFIGVAALAVGAGASGHHGPLCDSLAGTGAGAVAAGLALTARATRVGAGVVALLAPWGACLGWTGGLAAAVGLGVSVGYAVGSAVVRPNGSGFVSSLPLAPSLAIGLIAALVVSGVRA